MVDDEEVRALQPLHLMHHQVASLVVVVVRHDKAACGRNVATSAQTSQNLDTIPYANFTWFLQYNGINFSLMASIDPWMVNLVFLFRRPMEPSRRFRY